MSDFIERRPYPPGVKTSYDVADEIFDLMTAAYEKAPMEKQEKLQACMTSLYICLGRMFSYGTETMPDALKTARSWHEAFEALIREEWAANHEEQQRYSK